MHELFYIPELIGLICEALRLDSFSHRNDPHAARKALATLARTAKVFREPALSSLWYTQHTLVNLVKVLPHFLWREQHYTVRVLKASRLRHELVSTASASAVIRAERDHAERQPYPHTGGSRAPRLLRSFCQGALHGV